MPQRGPRERFVIGIIRGSAGGSQTAFKKSKKSQNPSNQLQQALRRFATTFSSFATTSDIHELGNSYQNIGASFGHANHNIRAYKHLWIFWIRIFRPIGKQKTAFQMAESWSCGSSVLQIVGCKSAIEFKRVSLSGSNAGA
jgi:hypothetical protein